MFRKWSSVEIVARATKIIIKHKRSLIYSSPTSHDVVLAQRLQRSSSYFLSGVRVCFGCKNCILMFIVRRIVITTTSINILINNNIFSSLRRYFFANDLNHPKGLTFCKKVGPLKQFSFCKSSGLFGGTKNSFCK